MKKSKSEKIVVIMHQHRDEFNIKFGSSHPINAEHKNKKTQKFHDMTMKRA